MRVGAIVVGIQDYRAAAYRNGVFGLQYAVEDAKAFAGYLSSAWRDEQLFLRCLPDEKATADGISEAAGWLAGQHVEMLFVYLSGHGEEDSKGDGWFCLVDAEPGKRSLNGASLDEVFEKVGAPTSLLLLDCCYAASVLSGSRFFSNLQNAHARLFLCSSRAGQRTWEDNSEGHGVFSKTLLEGLSTESPIRKTDGSIDVEADLLPYLCEQVPLRVLRAKGNNRQEPVKGGMSSGPVAIPTVSAQLLGRQLSTYDLVRLGTRRWLGRIAVATVVALVVVQLCFYHLVIGAAGEIEVLPGLKATEAFSVFARPIDTGITRNDLVTRAEDPTGMLRSQLVALSDGDLWGDVFQRQSNGLETWFAQLMPMLNPGARARATVLATGRLPSGFRSAEPDQNAPPFRAILDALLLEGEAAPDVRSMLKFSYKLPRATDLSCAESTARRIDFDLLNPASQVITSDVAWSVAHAALQPSEAIAGVLDEARVVSYRIAHAPDVKGYEPGKESKALADALNAVSTMIGVSTRTTPGLVVQESAPGSWCAPGFAMAELFLGGRQSSRKAAIVLASNVKAFNDAISDPVALAESEAALAALRVYAGTKKLPGAAVDEVIHAAKGGGLGNAPDTADWLRAIAPHQEFSAEDIGWLFSQMGQDAKDDGFQALEAFDILSRTAKHLQEDQKRRLAAWYAEELPRSRTMSLFADAAGYLGAVTDLSPSPVSFLSGRLVPGIYISGRAATRRGTEIIRSTDFRAGIGLGVIGQSKRLPHHITDRLYRFAIIRANVGDLRDVYKGLARQRSVPGPGIPNAIVRRLLATRNSRANRHVEIGIATAEIVDQRPAERKRVLAALGKKWRKEAEPEVRMALARVIVDSKLRIDGISLPEAGRRECIPPP